jgi:hypothetical protein
MLSTVNYVSSSVVLENVMVLDAAHEIMAIPWTNVAVLAHTEVINFVQACTTVMQRNALTLP